MLIRYHFQVTCTQLTGNTIYKNGVPDTTKIFELVSFSFKSRTKVLNYILLQNIILDVTKLIRLSGRTDETHKNRTSLAT
jgi:hypothetical protein